MMRLVKWVLAAVAAMAMASPVLASSPAVSPHWLATWGASPMGDFGGNVPAQKAQSFTDVTLRQVVRISAGGEKVRIRFSNEFGAAPLHIGAAHIALPGDGGAIKPGSDHVLTFGGKPTAVIPPGAPLVSDPVDMPVANLTSLAVSLYLPGASGPCTCHGSAMATTYVSDKGDATGATAFPTAAKIQARAFLSGVEVLTDKPGGTIVAFGDSITDGYRSTPVTNNRWPDILAERLAARGGAWGVVNEGISGNRVLSDGAGVNALQRFDRDVLAQPGARYVIVLEAINDIGVAFRATQPGAPLTPSDLIGGYRQLIERAHEHGLKIFLATLTPYEGATYASPAGETVRGIINSWIRSQHEADGVIDFDAVWRDPSHPGRILPNLDPGDHLHGNDAGYQALGKAVKLELFR